MKKQPRALLLAGLATLLAGLVIDAGAASTNYRAFSFSQAQREIRSSGFPKAEVSKVGSITRPIALVYDESRQDVVLVGEADPTKEPMTLDDAAVAMRAVLKHDKVPLVSIDRTPNTDRSSAQLVRFDGGIENTRFGRDLLESDVLLKKIALGLRPGAAPGSKSYAEMSAERWKSSKSELAVMSRFWFIPSENSQIATNRGIAFIEHLSVAVLTELMGASQTNAPARDEIADLFTDDINRQMEALAKEHHAIGRLGLLFRVSGLMQVLGEWRKAYGERSLGLDYWVNGYQVPMELTADRVPLLATAPVKRQGDDARLTIDGGIDLKMLLTEWKEGSSTALRQLVILSRPATNSLVWTVPLDEEPSAASLSALVNTRVRNGASRESAGDEAMMLRQEIRLPDGRTLTPVPFRSANVSPTALGNVFIRQAPDNRQGAARYAANPNWQRCSANVFRNPLAGWDPRNTEFRTSDSAAKCGLLATASRQLSALSCDRPGTAGARVGSAKNVMIHISDLGIEQWKDGMRTGDDFSHPGVKSLYSSVPRSGQILVVMPRDEELRSMTDAQLTKQIYDSVKERISSGLAQGTREFEIRGVQNINAGGYGAFDMDRLKEAVPVEGWLDGLSRQEKVSRWAKCEYTAISQAYDDLKKEGLNPRMDAWMLSNGVKAFAENASTWGGRVSSAMFVNGRAMKETIVGAVLNLGEKNVTMISTKKDAPAPNNPMLRSTGNFDVDRDIKREHPGIHLYQLETDRGYLSQTAKALSEGSLSERLKAAALTFPGPGHSVGFDPAERMRISEVGPDGRFVGSPTKITGDDLKYPERFNAVTSGSRNTLVVPSERNTPNLTSVVSAWKESTGSKSIVFSGSANGAMQERIRNDLGGSGTKVVGAWNAAPHSSYIDFKSDSMSSFAGRLSTPYRYEPVEQRSLRDLSFNRTVNRPTELNVPRDLSFSRTLYEPNVKGVLLQGAAQVEGGMVGAGELGLVFQNSDGQVDFTKLRRFATALWAGYLSVEGPGISIDPKGKKENTQHVRHIGCVRSTDLGRIMRETDYLMKRWAIGTHRPDIAGFLSPDEISDKTGHQVLGRASRFWLLPQGLTFKKAGGMLVLSTGRMTVQTEYLEDNAKGEKNPENERFAKWFTDNYEQISEQYPIYQELFEYAQLVGLCTYLKEQKMPLLWFVLKNREMILTERAIDDVPALSKKSGYKWFVNISGGVELEATKSVRDKTRITEDAELAKTVEQASADAEARPGNGKQVMFTQGNTNYTVSQAKSLSLSGTRATGDTVQTDFSDFQEYREGEGANTWKLITPGLELIRHFNPERSSAAQFGPGWHLAVPFELTGGNRAGLEEGMAPRRLELHNVLSGEREAFELKRITNDGVARLVYAPTEKGGLIEKVVFLNGAWLMQDRMGATLRFDSEGWLTEMDLRPETTVPVKLGDKVGNRRIPGYSVRYEYRDVAGAEARGRRLDKVVQGLTAATLEWDDTSGTPRINAIRVTRSVGTPELVRYEYGAEGRLSVVQTRSGATRIQYQNNGMRVAASVK